MLRIALEREDDGRWLGQVPELAGVMAYGATQSEARRKATALAFHVIAERIEQDELVPIDLWNYFIWPYAHV
jgi:predicted RNase H-like HicB family nuclease